MLSKLLPKKRDEPLSTIVFLNATPKDWQKHRFGLSLERWRLLKDKNIWITGAGTGFGQCLAIACALSGAQIFLSGRRVEKLEETAREIKSYGVDKKKLYLLPLDLTQPEQVQTACQSVQNSCPSLYGLIHCAAMPAHILSSPLQEEPVTFWDQMMQTNVRAPWLLTRQIFPHMLKGGPVRVLSISSEAGWAFTQGFGIYNISKAALNSLTANLAEELKVSYPDEDIQINAIDPGQARTEMNTFSNEDPFTIVSMALILLTHGSHGPNGKFFHKDGRHLSFAHFKPYSKPLL